MTAKATTTTMRALRVHGGASGADRVAFERVEIPRPAPGEARIRVHAAALTRDELDWPEDRLPAIPSYEVSGVVEALGPGVAEVEVGEEVFALLPFDRDGGAAELAVAPAAVLAPKPGRLAHVESAALPLAALSACQGLFTHGRLKEGERVLVHGAGGGVGHLAIQLARARGAYVVGTASAATVEAARRSGADEVVDRTETRFEDAVPPVDLVFDTVGGDVLARSPAVIRDGGRLVSVAEEPPSDLPEGVRATYFVVEPRREELVTVAELVGAGLVRPQTDSVFALADGQAAFERVAARGKSGKVVLRIVDE